MSITRVDIQGNMIVWALERSGKDVDAYLDSHPDVQAWIEERKKPTFKKLEGFAKSMNVPLGYLFLDEPPMEEMPIPMFRRNTRRLDINVYDKVMQMQDRQEWLADYKMRLGMEPLPFVGVHNVHDTAREVAERMRSLTELPICWVLDTHTVREALKNLTSVLEDLGVIVTYSGVVDTFGKRAINVNECRGFTLVNKYAPFIFINSKDAQSAQLFTLVHEFAHILTGYSSGYGDDNMENTSDNERLCDSTAALFLLPEVLLRELWVEVGENYEVLCKKLKVSRYVIARCAKDYGLITATHYFNLYREWMAESVVVQANATGSVDQYLLAIRRVSRIFLIHVNNALSRNMLLHTEAYRLTGMKGDTFRKVINNKYMYN